MVVVLVIIVVSMIVLTAMVGLSVAVYDSVIGWQRSTDALLAAESAVDDYFLRLIRTPSLTPAPGEQLVMNHAQAYIEVTPASSPDQTHTLVATGVADEYVRRVFVHYVFENDSLRIISRSEQ
jgi:type II secretory pathway pseudopilin PulG